VKGGDPCGKAQNVSRNSPPISEGAAYWAKQNASACKGIAGIKFSFFERTVRIFF